MPLLLYYQSISMKLQICTAGFLFLFLLITVGMQKLVRISSALI
jgi:hypothetical protein